MDKKQIVFAFWNDVAAQNAEELRKYFLPEAEVRWHGTNELFTVWEFIRANCEYPGDWSGEVERIELNGDLAVSVTRVWLTEENLSFHVTSFIKFVEDKIITIDEYWGDDGVAPQWRLDKKIGKVIR